MIFFKMPVLLVFQSDTANNILLYWAGYLFTVSYVMYELKSCTLWKVVTKIEKTQQSHQIKTQRRGARYVSIHLSFVWLPLTCEQGSYRNINCIINSL